MVVINRGPIDILLGFVISNIPNSTINQAIADFKLGAFHEYTPMVELSLDKTRFIGFSPEQIRDQLYAEDVRESFILLDAETTLSRSVWWVGKYLDEEEMDVTVLDQWRQSYVVNASSDERVLLKARFKTTGVPLFHANDAIGNMCIFDIIDGLSHPFDPHGPQEPFADFDWERDPPPPPTAYIVATPDEYEKSNSAEHTPDFVMPGEGLIEMVRLREDIARVNNLRSQWTRVGMGPRSEEGFPEGKLAFSQPWALRD